MGSSYTDDFFREVYNAEIEQRHKLDSADSVLVGVLLALSGVGIYYFKFLPSCGFGIAGYVFLLFSFLFLIAFGFATGFVIGSFWPRDKGYISNPEDWGRYVAGLEEYYGHYHDKEETNTRVADELAKMLRQQYIKAGEINRNLNIKKMGYQTWVRRCITAAVVILGLNAYPTYLVQCAKSDTQKTAVIGFPEVQKVEIVIPKPKDESNGRREETTLTTTPATADPTTQTSTTKAPSSRDSASPGRANTHPQARPLTSKD